MRLVGRHILVRHMHASPHTSEPISCWVAMIKGNSITSQRDFWTLFPRATEVKKGTYIFTYQAYQLEIIARISFQTRVVIVEEIK